MLVFHFHYSFLNLNTRACVWEYICFFYFLHHYMHLNYVLGFVEAVVYEVPFLFWCFWGWLFECKIYFVASGDNGEELWWLCPFSNCWKEYIGGNGENRKEEGNSLICLIHFSMTCKFSILICIHFKISIEILLLSF